MHKESEDLFDKATRIAGQYRASHMTSGTVRPLVKGKPGCDPLGEPEPIQTEAEADAGRRLSMLRAGVDPRDIPASFDPKRLLPADSATRKEYPMCTGFVDYFPDATAEVAHISFLGNQKHNPGEPLHHARGKSMDHADCIMRHLTERGTFDAQGIRHTAQLAWRALALLQEELEKDLGLPLPRGAT